MFRAQQNAFDDAIAKATDENLTNEDWSLILDVCDRVGAESTGAKDAVAALIKRLAHRNANVQLYTLELANALSQNCGRKIHQELASRSFTDALLRLANDRNTHHQVKSKILERMSEWTDMFSKDADLGIMEQAYSKLKSQNPNLHPPSKPTKRQITDVDRQKEEDELQMALALSVKEKKPIPSQSSGKRTSPGPSATGATQQTRTTQPPSQGTTAATVSRVKALYDFVPSEPGELQFRKGDIIAVLESVYKDWWKGSIRGQTGIFPLNYVEKLADPTEDELQSQAQMEAEVFGEIKNVEKLLTLLSTSSSELNVRENEEITELYHSTLAIRPKLIELIRKYSQKKDEFTQLNEKFIKARRDYESLLEASMSQPSQQTYGRQTQQYPYGGGYPQGGPPPQQGPGRFYTPGPDPNTGRPPQQQNPPRNDPQPFTYATQPNQSQQALPVQHLSEPQQRLPSGSAQDPYGQHRPQSTYDNPQELSTSAYASPADSRPSQTYPPQFSAVQQQQQQQQDGYSPSVYSPDDVHQSQQLPPQPQSTYGGQPPYPSNAPTSQPPQQPYPHYDAPPPPQGPPAQVPPPQAPSPNLGQNPYPTLNSGPPGAGGQYQSYRPPAALQPGHAATAGGDASDYYR